MANFCYYTVAVYPCVISYQYPFRRHGELLTLHLSVSFATILAQILTMLVCLIKTRRN